MTHRTTDPTGATEINAVQPCPIAEVPANGSVAMRHKRGGSVPHRVIEVEVFGGRVWREVVSPDGVLYQIGTLRKRALHDGGAS